MQKVLPYVISPVIWLAIIALGAALCVGTDVGNSATWTGQLFFWTLGVTVMVIPAQILLRPADSITVVAVTTGIVLVLGITGDLFLGGTFALRTRVAQADLFAVIWSTLAMATAWIALAAVGRTLSRGWSGTRRGLLLVAYWIFIAGVFEAYYAIVLTWVVQLYVDAFNAMDSLFLIVGRGPYYPVLIYHWILGVSVFVLIVSLLAQWYIRRRRRDGTRAASREV